MVEGNQVLQVLLRLFHIIMLCALVCNDAYVGTSTEDNSIKSCKAKHTALCITVALSATFLRN